MAIENNMAGYLMTFKPGADDPIMDHDVLVECVDRTDGFVELAFDMKHPARRVYLKFRMADLRAIATQDSPHDQP